ncbi:hypothetical protein Anapl_05785 [Anas platyrhynchos]|uniref:Uncharacterized protein n=1 Tax=Anas platyrhynchos TaxID=8839 RepID=R0KE99_ANAPL|nr:hypothetical protein Anapl_05785 [Anas platyrhynchos]
MGLFADAGLLVHSFLTSCLQICSFIACSVMTGLNKNQLVLLFDLLDHNVMGKIGLNDFCITEISARDLFLNLSAPKQNRLEKDFVHQHWGTAVQLLDVDALGVAVHGCVRYKSAVLPQFCPGHLTKQPAKSSTGQAASSTELTAPSTPVLQSKGAAPPAGFSPSSPREQPHADLHLVL